MDKDILQKGDLNIALKEGNLVLLLDTKSVDISVSVDSGYFIDKLMELIPGTLDDTVLTILKGALKG